MDGESVEPRFEAGQGCPAQIKQWGLVGLRKPALGPDLMIPGNLRCSKTYLLIA